MTKNDKKPKLELTLVRCVCPNCRKPDTTLGIKDRHENDIFCILCTSCYKEKLNHDAEIYKAKYLELGKHIFDDIFGPNMKDAKCNDIERISYSKQYFLNLKKKLYQLTEEEQKELDEWYEKVNKK